MSCNYWKDLTLALMGGRPLCYISPSCQPLMRLLLRWHRKRCDFLLCKMKEEMYVYLMKHKSETFEVFKEFQNEVQNQLGKTIKALRSDRGGEYLSQEFVDHLKQCGIVPQLTPSGTPQWNGVSERRNRTLLDMVRSMISQTDCRCISRVTH